MAQAVLVGDRVRLDGEVLDTRLSTRPDAVSCLSLFDDRDEDARKGELVMLFCLLGDVGRRREVPRDVVRGCSAPRESDTLQDVLTFTGRQVCSAKPQPLSRGAEHPRTTSRAPRGGGRHHRADKQHHEFAFCARLIASHRKAKAHETRSGRVERRVSSTCHPAARDRPTSTGLRH